MLYPNFEHDNSKKKLNNQEICNKNPFDNAVAKVLDSLLWK